MTKPYCPAAGPLMTRRKALAGIAAAMGGIALSNGCVAAKAPSTTGLELRIRQRLRHDGVLKVAWSPDGTRLVSAGNGCILWDPLTGEKLHEMASPWAAFVVSEPIHFTPDGRDVLVVSDNAKVNGAWVGFGLWNVSSGRLEREIPAPSSFGLRAAGDPTIVPLPGGRHALVTFVTRKDWPVLVYDVRSWKPVHVALRLPEGGAASIAVSPDGRLLAIGNVRPGDFTGEPKGRIWIYGLPEGRLIRRIDGAHKDSTGQVAFSPDSRFVASSPGQLGSRDLNVTTHELELMNDIDPIRIWDVATGEKIASFEGPFPGASSLAFHPTRPWLGASLGTIVGMTKGPEFRIWNWRSPELLATEGQFTAGANCMAFSPDGRFVSMAGSNKWGGGWIDIAELKANRGGG